MSVALWLLTLLSLSVMIDASKETGREEGAMEKLRGSLHGLKKILKKHLVPALLIAYKMKALLGLVGATMSLSALGTAVGLAAFFFTLFTVAICSAHEHRHSRHERRHDEDLGDPRFLRAMEAI